PVPADGGNGGQGGEVYRDTRYLVGLASRAESLVRAGLCLPRAVLGDGQRLQRLREGAQSARLPTSDHRPRGQVVRGVEVTGVRGSHGRHGQHIGVLGSPRSLDARLQAGDSTGATTGQKLGDAGGEGAARWAAGSGRQSAGSLTS